MKFLSIKEYFYKLNTIGFILLLLPMGVFIFLYYRAIHNQPLISQQDDALNILWLLMAALLAGLAIIHWMWVQKIKRLKNLIELARKMDEYFALTIFKMSMYCIASLIIAAGFFLTANSGFTALFIVLALVAAIQRPRPSSFSRHLSLNKNERDMILNNRDLYQGNKRV